jgi:hypothetical protein
MPESGSLLSLLQPLQVVAAAATTMFVAVAQERRPTVTAFEIVEGCGWESVGRWTDPV